MATTQVFHCDRCNREIRRGLMGDLHLRTNEVKDGDAYFSSLDRNLQYELCNGCRKEARDLISEFMTGVEAMGDAEPQEDPLESDRPRMVTGLGFGGVRAVKPAEPKKEGEV